MENFRNCVSIGLIIKLNNNVFLYIKKISISSYIAETPSVS